MEIKKIKPVIVTTSRLVKNEDLNHHGTLFAGRTAEWFVESGFIAVASILNPKYVVCSRIHGMQFKKPVGPGTILTFTSKTIYSTKKSITSYVAVNANTNNEMVVDGFITFVYVDENTRPVNHNLEIADNTVEDIHLMEKAKKLLKDNKNDS